MSRVLRRAPASDVARTTGMRLIAGRDLAWGDIEGKRRVAVVTEEMARYFFGDVNAVGRRYSSGNTYDPSADWEIVGVVSNAKYTQVRGNFPRTAYVPFSNNRGVLRGLYFHVRAPGDPLAVAASVRSVVQSVDPSLAIVDMNTMTNQIRESLWQEHLFARLTTIFSLLALTLACVGLYGTVSYGVGRRRSEIAVRVALGARYSQVLWMILRQAVGLALAGVAVGIPLSMWASKYVSTLLYG